MNEQKAMVWELALTNGNTRGLRILVSGTRLARQELLSNNERPRWTIEQYETLKDAVEVATSYTRLAETDYQGRIAVAPVEVMVHPSEQARLSPGNPIPPALRARVFSALDRGRKEQAGAS